MAGSGTFGFIRFNPELDSDLIEEIIDDLGYDGFSDIEYDQWNHKINIGDPLDFNLIDLIVSTIKRFKVEDYIEDIRLNCN